MKLTVKNNSEVLEKEALNIIYKASDLVNIDNIDSLNIEESYIVGKPESLLSEDPEIPEMVTAHSGMLDNDRIFIIVTDVVDPNINCTTIYAVIIILKDQSNIILK